MPQIELENPQTDETGESVLQEEQPKKKLLITILIIVSVVFLIFMVVLLSFLHKRTEVKNLLYCGDFDKAYFILKDHGKTNDEIKQFVYEEAKRLYHSEKYDVSYMLLHQIGKDEAVKKSKYFRASQAIKENDCELAFSLLYNLDYNDSLKLIQSVLNIHPEYAFSKCDIGDIVFFGNYEQDNDVNNGPEPIEWEIVTKDSDRALLISKCCLDMKRYDKSNKDNWGKSIVRQWLNKDFLNAAFEKDSQKAIIPSKLKDVGTTDKLFLLNFGETQSYSFTMVAKATKYAQSKGLVCKNDNSCNWVIRSSLNTSFVNIIDFDGKTILDYVNKQSGIRPAMWVDLSLINPSQRTTE